MDEKRYMLSGGTLIPPNADLNTYSDPGNYYCSSDTNAGTIVNNPIGGMGFILKVEQSIGTDYPRQIIIGYANGRTYCRTKVEGSWSKWFQDSPFEHVEDTSIANFVKTRMNGSGFIVVSFSGLTDNPFTTMSTGFALIGYDSQFSQSAWVLGFTTGDGKSIEATRIYL